MIGKLIQRAVEFATREYWKARGIQQIHDAKDMAMGEIRELIRNLRTEQISSSLKGEIDQCVREHLSAAIATKTIDLEAAHAKYVEQYGKHATYGEPDRVRVGVNSGVSRSYDFASGLTNTRKAQQ